MVDTEYTIEELPDLLSGHLDQTTEIVNTKIKKLPQAGYGSIMLRVDLTVRTKREREKIIYMVAKLVPPSNKTKEIFNIQVTFRNEMAFCETIVPTLINFQRKNCITKELDMFAKFYGGRTSLNKNSRIVDDDAVLLLENLVESGKSCTGFQNIDKEKGIDLHGGQLILRDLARFHGTTIGFKLKEPLLFKKNIEPHCNSFEFTALQPVTDALEQILLENPKCAPLAHVVSSFPSRPVPKPREPYAGLVHGDLWVNNTMQKLENRKVVKNKFVDFQVYNYRSCSSDVFFFLWTSVQREVLEVHFDDLLKYYHKHLVETIAELKCATAAFTYDDFLEDMRYEASYEYGHALAFAMIVKGMKVPEEADDRTCTFPEVEEIIKTTPNSVKEDCWYLTQECHRRGWVY